MRVAVLFDHLGPYHLARLRAAAQQLTLLAIEFGGKSADYSWSASSIPEPFTRATLFPGGSSLDSPLSRLRTSLASHLEEFVPDAVAIPGWSSRGAFVGMQWCQRAGVPVVVMCDSTKEDEPRVVWKEWIKRRYVRGCASALAAGGRHREYLETLGLPDDRIFLGYDAVDNDYFTNLGKKKRGEEIPGLDRFHTPDTRRYFLASARFIAKKNLPFLLRAYDRFRSLARTSEIGAQRSEPWNLVLLGDGPLREGLNAKIAELGLGEFVSMPGFVQYEELPAYYSDAGAFVHASITEQWGLVVNEAMASGLPVIVSNRCGCAPDLVEEGANGWTFDPTDEAQLADLLVQIARMPVEQRAQMGDASRRIIAAWGPERFAEGLCQAAECAVEFGARRHSVLDHFLLEALLRR